ncbi:hypothetical protein CgunFtcFv8_019459 [Champsocephalus gunnari]|uniref:Uncharacterized protein n=1 Tax=Champsocephalus gunnari TaxID=52237 RepID=A0AAN8DLG8_CHAGU|nr:hypothetical protein CgunFtcFv8_019459 [Champsocephalus gunnari]
MTGWNEAAEPRCGVNTTLNTALPQLHTPDSTDSFPIHVSQQIRCSTRSGTLPSLEFSGKGTQGGVDARNRLLPTRLLASSLAAHSPSHRRRPLQLQHAVKGGRVSDTLKH